jgi:hypothetical protein
LANLIDIKTVTDTRGNLSVLEKLPFEIKRVYYLHGIDTSSMRGGHAHKRLKRIIVCVSGSFRISVRNKQWTDYVLDDPTMGLEVNPMEWLEINDFSEGAVCLVLASLEHDEMDCIRDFKEYLDGLKKYNKPRSLCDCNQGRLECTCIESL